MNMVYFTCITPVNPNSKCCVINVLIITPTLQKNQQRLSEIEMCPDH